MKTPNLSSLANLSKASPRVQTARSQHENERLLRTSVYLTPDLHRALKLRVIDERRDMSAIIRDAVTEYLRSGSGISN